MSYSNIPPILIVFYSVHGSTRALAEAIAQGVESIGVEAILRQVPRVSDNIGQHQVVLHPYHFALSHVL